MVYRDDHERCPRCGDELVDAGSVRACTACRGMWATQAVLVEMAANMRSPPQRMPLPCVPDPSREPLACPTCQQPMGTWRLHSIEIDRCERDGIWFDRDELERVLLASFQNVAR